MRICSFGMVAALAVATYAIAGCGLFGIGAKKDTSTSETASGQASWVEAEAFCKDLRVCTARCEGTDAPSLAAERRGEYAAGPDISKVCDVRAVLLVETNSHKPEQLDGLEKSLSRSCGAGFTRACRAKEKLEPALNTAKCPPQKYVAGANGKGETAPLADLNGDGHDEVVVAFGSPQQVSILSPTGDETCFKEVYRGTPTSRSAPFINAKPLATATNGWSDLAISFGYRFEARYYNLSGTVRATFDGSKYRWDSLASCRGSNGNFRQADCQVAFDEVNPDRKDVARARAEAFGDAKARCAADPGPCEEECKRTPSSEDCVGFAGALIKGNSKDLGRALKLMKATCKAGNRHACEFNDGFEKTAGECSDEAACKSFCEDEMASGCEAWAALYINGNGVPVSYPKGNALLKRACDLNQASACMKLGAAHFEGMGTPKNGLQAQKYFKKACDLGHEIACSLYQRSCLELPCPPK